MVQNFQQGQYYSPPTRYQLTTFTYNLLWLPRPTRLPLFAHSINTHHIDIRAYIHTYAHTHTHKEQADAQKLLQAGSKCPKRYFGQSSEKVISMRILPGILGEALVRESKHFKTPSGLWPLAANGQVTVRSQSGHSQVTVRSQSGHSQVMVFCA